MNHYAPISACMQVCPFMPRMLLGVYVDEIFFYPFCREKIKLGPKPQKEPCKHSKISFPCLSPKEDREFFLDKICNLMVFCIL